jgi:hypothetical protein
VTHLSFSHTIDEDEYYIISACKGILHDSTFFFSLFPVSSPTMDEANFDSQITIPCCEMALQVIGMMSPFALQQSVARTTN